MLPDCCLRLRSDDLARLPLRLVCLASILTEEEDSGDELPLGAVAKMPTDKALMEKVQSRFDQSLDRGKGALLLSQKP